MYIRIDGQEFTIVEVESFRRLYTRITSAGRIMVCRYLGHERSAADWQLRQVADLFARHSLPESEFERRHWPTTRTAIRFEGGYKRRFPTCQATAYTNRATDVA